MLNEQAMLTVWDSDLMLPRDFAGDMAMWRSFERCADPRVISIPRLVEAHADRLRSRYLAWVFDLGESRVVGKRLVDHLQLRPQLSYWWMTALAQRFNASGVSPIHDAIKLLALEELIVERNVGRLTLYTANEALARCLREFCNRMRIEFERHRSHVADALRRKQRPNVLSAWRKMLPLTVQAWMSLIRHVVQRRTSIREHHPLASDADVTFIDVLVHLNKHASVPGRFASNYWTGLVEQLWTLGLRSNWIHLFFKHPVVSTIASAERLVGEFNDHGAPHEIHVLLDEEITFAAVAVAVRDYFKLLRGRWRLRDIRNHFQVAGSSINLWALFRNEWLESLYGPNAIVNCLVLALFERMLARMPHQKLGVYIQENQPWEMALIYAWKAAGHGTLVGAPHTTVRYWDLRYFYDPRAFERRGNNSLPMPDRVALNGPAAREAYGAGGYPQRQIVEVEALRYLHLLNGPRELQESDRPRSSLRVLVCGDFLPETTHKLLELLTAAVQSLPADTRFTFKPHPAYPLDLKSGSLVFEVTDAPLSEVLAGCDVVFASSITSAVVDAYCSGVPVVQLLDGEAFNMSPLRRMSGVAYVTTAEELAQALALPWRNGGAVAQYFYLDVGLPRWCRLLRGAV